MERRRLFYQIGVFVLNYIGFALIHANRKVFSNVKTTIAAEWTPSFSNKSIKRTLPDQTWNDRHLFANGDEAELFLGTLDTVFMFSYAVGLFLSGIIGDRCDLRKVISFGMCSSAVTVFIFGVVSEWTHTYNAAYYVIFWGLTGLFQSLEWPGMIAVMGNWFNKSSRGVVFGVWSSCASAGNIMGSLLVARVVGFGYEYAFLVPSVCLFSWGLIVFVSLVPHPNDVGVYITDDETLIVPHETDPLLATGSSEDQASSSSSSAELDIPDKPQAMSCYRAWLLPGVIPYSLGYASLKFVNYAFFFWLPYYLTKAFNWSQSDADSLSIWYDVGGIIGGTIAGFITDRLNKRAPVMEVMLLIAAPSLYFYTLSPPDKVKNAALLSLVGFFAGGPSNIISSAISADLGKQEALRNNLAALGTVTGIVDGTGSVGAAVGQVLVPVLRRAFGWNSVFYMFISMILLTFLCILPVAVRELRDTACWLRRRPSSVSNVPRFQG